MMCKKPGAHPFYKKERGANMSSIDNVLEFRHITKYYPGVTALNDVSLEVRQRRNPCSGWGKWCGKIDTDQDLQWSN